MAQIQGRAEKKTIQASHRLNPLVIVENRHDVDDYLRPGVEGKSFSFITFDWLTLESLKTSGNNAIPIEEFIPRDVGLKYQEIMESRSRDWFIFRGEDVTEYHGISLGAAFTLELLQYFAYAFRYGIALARAVRELDPSHLVAYLIPEDHPYLEYAIKREVITRVACEHGLMLNRYESIGPAQIKKLPEVISRDIYHLDPGKKLFFRIVSGLSTVIDRFRMRKPEVLLIPEGFFYNPFFERYLDRIGDLGYRITFPVMNLPPRSLALELIRRGTIPFYPRKQSLKRGSRRGVATVRRRIAELMVKPEWKSRWQLEGIDFSSVFERIIREVVIPDIDVTADFALKCMGEMDRRPITTLVVPNDKARSARIMLEAANRMGIKTFYFEHGLTTNNVPSSIIGGKKLVDTMICWGEKDRNAYRSQGVEDKYLIERTPPFLADYLPMRPRRQRGSGRILILQHGYSKDHINGVDYYEEKYLIDLSEGLRSIGVGELRLKIHPGMSLRAYFEKLVKERKLDIEVFKNENLKSLILWSDLVIGPISTAVLEVLTLGRDYYCVDLEGLGYTDISPFDNDRIRIFSSIDEVIDAIRHRGPSPCSRDVIHPICGIDRSTTHKKILDPLLDLFDPRCRSDAYDRLPETGGNR